MCASFVPAVFMTPLPGTPPPPPPALDSTFGLAAGFATILVLVLILIAFGPLLMAVDDDVGIREFALLAAAAGSTREKGGGCCCCCWGACGCC